MADFEYENESTFIVTINPNQKDIDRDILYEAAKSWISNYLPLTFMYHRGSQSKKEGWNQIKSIQFVTASLEVGNKFKRDHIHVLIRILHDTNIQVDAKSTGKIFEKLLDLSANGTVYVNSRYISPGETNLLRAKSYVEKEGDIISF